MKRYCERLDDYVERSVYLGGLAHSGYDYTKFTEESWEFINAMALVDLNNAPLDNLRGCFQGMVDIENALAEDSDVLVFCGLGELRSPLVVAFWLVHVCGWTWDQAYTHISRLRSNIIPGKNWVHVEPEPYPNAERSLA